MGYTEVKTGRSNRTTSQREFEKNLDETEEYELRRIKIEWWKESNAGFVQIVGKR